MVLHRPSQQLLHLCFFLASLIMSLSSNTAPFFIVEAANNKKNDAKKTPHPYFNSNDKVWDPYEIDWEESHASFVPYPKDAYALLELRQTASRRPVILDVSAHVADWEQPIFALLKGIVHRNHRVTMTPHFFVQDGSTASCHDDDPSHNNHDNHHQRRRRRRRRGLTDAEDVIDTPVSAAVATLPENCTRHCTNHGRYCLEDPAVAGAELVAEAARRMCFEYVLHDTGNLAMFHYLEHFRTAQCHQQKGDGTWADCSRRAMDQAGVEITAAAMDQCLQGAGGFEKDVPNMELEEQLDYQRQLQLPATIQAATPKLPVVEIEGQAYTGDYTVPDLFRAVCAAFPGNAQPLSCDFCQNCTDVRKCLWTLECDGQPFDVVALLGAQRLGDPEPLETNAQLEADAQRSNGIFGWGTPSGWEVGFVWGLAGGLIIAVCFMIRELRTRRMVEEKVHKRVVEDLSWQPEPLGLPDLNNVSEALNSGPLGSGPLGSIEESDSEEEEEFESFRDEEVPSSKDKGVSARKMKTKKKSKRMIV